MAKFTDRDKAREARREINQRRKVYPRLVEAWKMQRETADRQIAIMQEIAADYEAKARADEAGERLF